MGANKERATALTYALASSSFRASAAFPGQHAACRRWSSSPGGTLECDDADNSNVDSESDTNLCDNVHAGHCYSSSSPNLNPTLRGAALA